MKSLLLFLVTTLLFTVGTQSSNIKQKLAIADDSGFIGLVNSELYQGFVDEDWELKDLMKRFKEQTNLGHATVWSTGVQNTMTVHILQQPSAKKHHRQTTSQIKVTNDTLWLVNYTDLSMLAQFDDETIPSRDNDDLSIPLKSGNYSITLRQMFDPEEYRWNNPPDPCFELTFTPTTKPAKNRFKDVIWWREDR